MSLEQDIARIAALRGKSSDDYRPESRGIAASSLDMLVHMSPDTALDTKAFDALPALSRAFIAEWPRPINSRAWRSLLEHYSETFLIRAFKEFWTDQTGTQGEPVSRRPKPRRRWS